MKGFKVLAGATLAVLLAIPALSLAQQMYRWVDADGEVYYSDQPPPPHIKEYRELNRPSSTSEPAAESNAPTQSLADQEADFQKRRAQEAEQEAKAERLAAERRQNCDLARSQFNTVSAGGRISRRNSAGEVVYLDDDEVAREAENARAEVEKWCDS